MTFRDLLLRVGAGMEDSEPYGLWLAAACEATLTAACPVVDPDLPPSVTLELPDDIRTHIREDAVNEAARVLREFALRAGQKGIAVETLAFKAPAGEADRETGRLARYYDATLLQQPDPEGLDTSGAIKAALFESGRPILIIPYITARPEIRTALIAWDGGHTAARALGDAVPLLRLATQVQIVTIDKNSNENRRVSGEILVRHLTRHGIPAEFRYLTTDIDAADTLLSYAFDSAADLIVMGGYGHSRLREIVLGGMTQTILRSMTVPVLMAH